MHTPRIATMPDRPAGILTTAHAALKPGLKTALRASSISRRLLLAVLFLAANFASATTTAATAVFAGGCFWCVEALYEEIDGVSDVISGFTGGHHPNPTYKGRHDGHWEAVKVTYDPGVVSYQRLLDLYWVNIDPFDDRGQFCDKGRSYRAAIFVDDTQRPLAEASLAAVRAEFSNGRVVTGIHPVARFFPVEEYHQDYSRKNPLRYRYYRHGCRRDERLQTVWGDRAH
jgi:peptide-methionine (S)-S-oxide reductase